MAGVVDNRPCVARHLTRLVFTSVCVYFSDRDFHIVSVSSADSSAWFSRSSLVYLSQIMEEEVCTASPSGSGSEETRQTRLSDSASENETSESVSKSSKAKPKTYKVDYSSFHLVHINIVPRTQMLSAVRHNVI